MKKFKNLSKIRVKGLNQERAISKLSKDVKIYNIDRIDKSQSEFEVDIASLKKVKSSLISDGLEVEILSKKGFFYSCKNFFKNVGIISAIVLIFVIYLCQFHLIWKIDVYGTEVIDKKQITQYIKDNFSLNKNSLDTKEVELSIKENFKRISSVSVATVGQTLIVNIHESYIPSELDSQFSPIYSNFDCKIEKINLIQGTLAVNVGDIVQNGDVLVYPYIFDSQGQKRDVYPDAEITASVWLVGSADHYEEYYETYRTGNFIQNQIVTLYGLAIYSNTKEVTYKQYEEVKSEEYISKNNILPLKLQKTYYYETENRFVAVPFEEVKDKKIEEAKQNSLIYLQEYDIIKDENANITSNVGAYHVNYVITVERKIGARYEDLF